MQKNLLNSSSIRLQIAKGGTNDLQLHLNRYRVSVHYTTSKPYRLIAVVFRVVYSGMVPLVRFAFPADESVLATDYKTFVRLIYDIDKKGRNEVAILHDDGVVFVSGGLVTGSGTGTSDSITAKLSNGEAVMTARAVANWGDSLSAINVSSGGNAIPTNNLPQKGGRLERNGTCL